MTLRACGFLLLMTPCLLGVDLLRVTNKNIEQGNAQLQAGQAEEALKLYEKALAEDGLSDQQARAAAEFNRGAALAALNKNDDAAQAFLEATKSKDVSLRARAFYNLGNTFFRGEKFSEAVEALKRSLVLDPKNADAKWNLELALRRKREQDDKEKQDKNDKGDKDNKDKNDQKNDQDKNEQDKSDQDKSDQDKNDQDKQKQDPNDSKQEQDQKQDDPSQDDSSKENEPPDDQSQGDNQKPPEAEPPEPTQDQQAPQPDQGKPQGAAEPPGAAADMKEINAILDSLEQGPQEIERQRARIRATRQRAPVKDW